MGQRAYGIERVWDRERIQKRDYATERVCNRKYTTKREGKRESM